MLIFTHTYYHYVFFSFFNNPKSTIECFARFRIFQMSSMVYWLVTMKCFGLMMTDPPLFSAMKGNSLPTA